MPIGPRRHPARPLRDGPGPGPDRLPRRSACPLGGAFDRGSADLANALLGNPADAAVLELTLVGGTYEARGPLALALAGRPDGRDGPQSPTAARRRSRSRSASRSAAGDRLTLGGDGPGGAGLPGGPRRLANPVILGSRSSETPLEPGDVLPCEPGWTPVRHPDRTLNPFATADDRPLAGDRRPRRRPASDAAWLDGGRVYRVGPQSDRMGLRLEGPAGTSVADPDRVSTPGGARGGAGGGGKADRPGGRLRDDGRISARRPRDLGRPRPARPGPAGRPRPVRAGDARRGAAARPATTGGERPRGTAAASRRRRRRVAAIELAGFGGIG